MLRQERNHAEQRRRPATRSRTALIIHDGSGFALGQWFRNHDFETLECPPIAAPKFGDKKPDVVVVAVRKLPERGARVLKIIRDLCWGGVPVVAIGAAAEPLLTLFGPQEFSVTATGADGAALTMSHVFRPVHSLHEVVLDSADLRSTVFRTLIRSLPVRDSPAG